MFNRTRVLTKTEDSDKKSIIVAIVTGNVGAVRNLINLSNYNDALDDTGLNALQYAITSPDITKNNNDEIIRYLLEVGADPKLKLKNQTIDSFDLAIKYNKRYLFEYFNKNQEFKIQKLKEVEHDLNNKITDLQTTINYQSTSIDSYNVKIVKLNNEIKAKDNEIKSKNNEIKVKDNEIKVKDNEIVDLKRKNKETSDAFSNLLKKTKLK